MGGVELGEILDEPKWLQLIYFIENAKEKEGNNYQGFYPQRQRQARFSSSTKSSSRAKHTPMEQIKAILNYKII